MVGFLIPFRNTKKFPENFLDHLLTAQLLLRNAKRKLIDFHLLIYYMPYPLRPWIWFFRWIEGFVLKIIRNLGISSVLLRIAFRLFSIDWNQDKLNRWSKEIELGCYVHYIYQYIYQKDTYCRLISIKPLLFIFLYSTTCSITINYCKNNS